MNKPGPRLWVIGADFIVSAVEPKGWPQGKGPEVAFCGRSNVGKSTLLNAVCGRTALARVSRTPGRTRLLNFFSVTVREDGGPGGSRHDHELVLADLPGFGYAQVSKTERSAWQGMVERYFTGRAELRAVVLLIDSRRALEVDQDPTLLQEEAELYRWLQGLGKAVVVVMTKADKLSKNQRKPAAARAARLLGCGGQMVVFSAHTGEGLDDLWRRLVPHRTAALREQPPAAAAALRD